MNTLLRSHTGNDKPIYLDYMATTPMDPAVIDVMQCYLGKEACFGNPASQSHRYGWEARQAVEIAREQVANLINAKPQEIVWTSGATEANNLALKGAAHFYSRKGKHIITCQTEHKAVLDTCTALESEGFEVTYLRPQANGILDIETLRAALRDDTILVSMMHANNEIGVLQDIAAIGDMLRGQGIIFHVDAAQSAGKVSIDLQRMAIDLMSFSAHKIYGPKGVGALYVRQQPRIRLQPQIHGGGHELGLRSGTLATHQIVAMGEAFAIAQQKMPQEAQNLLQLRQRFLQGLASLKGWRINGDMTQRLPSNVNIGFQNVDGEALMMALRELAISSGSACTSASIEPSYVLRAIGVPQQLAHSSVRISFGRFTTEQEVDRAAHIVCHQVNRLREISPLSLEPEIEGVL